MVKKSTHKVYKQRPRSYAKRKTKERSSKYPLPQFTKVYKKECFKAWLDRLMSLNTLSFLSFHKVHIKQKGAALQAFSFLLLTKAPCQPTKFLLIEECRTHYKPKKEKSKFHSIVAFLQNRIKWSLVSSSTLDK